MDADRKNKFPPHIRKKLEQRGYFELTKEERVKSHKECLKALSEVEIPDYKSAKIALRQMRGGES